MARARREPDTDFSVGLITPILITEEQQEFLKMLDEIDRQITTGKTPDATELAS